VTELSQFCRGSIKLTCHF